MAGFKDIVGNEQIIEHLQNAISMGKVSHAYIINGPQLSGKMMIAEAFARALQCEKEGTDGCGECKSCHQPESLCPDPSYPPRSQMTTLRFQTHLP